MSTDIVIEHKSRAYLHVGDTKYYRIAAVAVRVGDQEVLALLTNYGPYSATKGDLSMHKPMHGGTSAIQYFDTPERLWRTFGAHERKRFSRGYQDQMSFGSSLLKRHATPLDLRDAMRGMIGMIDAHYNEILEQLEPAPMLLEKAIIATGDTMTVKKPTIHEEFSSFIAGEKAKFSEKHASSAHRLTGAKAISAGLKAKSGTKERKEGKLPDAPPPELRIERGDEWGSW